MGGSEDSYKIQRLCDIDSRTQVNDATQFEVSII